MLHQIFRHGVLPNERAVLATNESISLCAPILMKKQIIESDSEVLTALGPLSDVTAHTLNRRVVDDDDDDDDDDDGDEYDDVDMYNKVKFYSDRNDFALRALRVSPAVTRLTVYRGFAVGK